MRHSWRRNDPSQEVRMTRPPWRLPLVGLSLSLLAAGIVAAYFATQAGAGTIHAGQAKTAQKGPVAGTYGNKRASLPDPPLPTSGPVNTCGTWAAENSAQALAVQGTHGTIQSCELVGHYWIVTTEGSAGAQIGELDCSPAESACMNGWDTKNLTAFAWVTPPPPITFVQVVLVQGDTIALLTNDGQWTFDIDTSTWARMSMTPAAAQGTS
jgi:hypothetical protein